MADSERDHASGKQSNTLKVAIITVIAATIAAAGGHYYALYADVIRVTEESVKSILLLHWADEFGIDLIRMFNELHYHTIGISILSLFLTAALILFFFNRKLSHEVIVQTLFLLKEIKEHKQTEEALLESNNSIRQLLETTDQGIYGIDMKGVCTFINRAGLQTLGYKHDECIGRNMHDLIHHSHSSGLPYPIEECPVFCVKSTGVGYRIDETVLWRKDRTSFPAEYSSYPILENGNISWQQVLISLPTNLCVLR